MAIFLGGILQPRFLEWECAFFFYNIELGWFWWRGIQYSHLSTCSILQPVWYFVHDYIAITTPSTPAPPISVQIHLHPLMISVKNCWHRMRQGGGRRLIWIKLDRRVDTALKVIRPFMSRWQGVCVCVCWVRGGRQGVAKEAYSKAGVYLRQ